MTFAGMAAWQAWLVLGAAALVAAAVFRIKLRPPRVSVPSLLLWRRVLDDTRALTWWERVRRAVSLAATVAIAVALALALTRPSGQNVASARGRLLIVLDSSWSMSTRTTDGPTRWERAVTQARALAGSASGDLVAVATTAEGLVEGPTADSALIDAAIARLSPSGADGGTWPRVADGAAVHFFTDGAVARTLDPAVQVHSVYERASNVAIIAFGLRPALAEGDQATAYLEIANYSDAAQDARLQLTRGGQVLLDKALPLSAGQALRTTVEIAGAGAPDVRARVSAPANALAVDDEAVAWMLPALNVVAVGDGRGVLPRLLQATSGVHATFVTLDAYRAGREDVVIFDRIVPTAAPERPALFVLPPAAPWLGRPAAEERNPRWAVSEPHPVLAGVDHRPLLLTRAVAFEGAGLRAIARSERGTPLVLVADARDRRLAILTIDPADLAQAPAFPVLTGNLLEWLARPGDGEVRQPGRAVLPPSTTSVAGPDGRPIRFVTTGDGVVATLPAPGLYTVEAGGSRRRIAVNAGDSQISQATRTSLQGASTVPVGEAAHPWWLYALVSAFALILVEWWTWQRRITV
jgi:hypothetical protein